MSDWISALTSGPAVIGPFVSERPPISRFRIVTFAALVCLILILETAMTVIPAEPTVRWSTTAWILAFCGAVMVAAFDPARGGLLVVAVALAEVLVGTEVVLAGWTIYLVAGDWISRQWYVPAGISLLLVQGVWFIRAESPTIVAVDTALGVTAAIMVGILVQKQRENLDLKSAEARKTAWREIEATLHDTTVQDLVQIMLISRGMAAQDGEGSVVQAQARQIESLAKRGLANLRTLATESPDGGLVESFSEALAASKKMLSVHGIKLTTTIPDSIDSRLPQLHRAVLNLVLRESSMNIAKYAVRRSTAAINLELPPDNDVLSLTITNQFDGGDSPERGTVSGGQGLRHLAARVQGVGGSMYQWAVDDQWVMRVDIPVDDDSAPAREVTGVENTPGR